MDKHLHDCGCDHEHHHHDSHRKIHLTLMDNTELECDVLDIFEANGKNYIAVLPQNSESALLYGFTEDEEGPELSNIENDKEYETASKAFMAIQNNNL